jgi:hypothetical protein
VYLQRRASPRRRFTVPDRVEQRIYRDNPVEFGGEHGQHRPPLGGTNGQHLTAHIDDLDCSQQPDRHTAPLDEFVRPNP